MNVLRVPAAKFKDDMRPFVEKAKTGEVVIITNHGHDDFRIVPCVKEGQPPVLSGLVRSEDYEGIDLDQPAFEPLQ